MLRIVTHRRATLTTSAPHDAIYPWYGNAAVGRKPPYEKRLAREATPNRRREACGRKDPVKMNVKHRAAVVAGLGIAVAMSGGIALPGVAMAEPVEATQGAETHGEEVAGEAYVTVDGEKQYGTLKELVEGAKADTHVTITLADDVTLTSMLEVPAGADIEIVGDGHVISFDGANPASKTVFNAHDGNNLEGLHPGTKVSVADVMFRNTGTAGSGYAAVIGFNSFDTSVSFTGCSFENLYCGLIANAQTELPGDGQSAPSGSFTDCTFDGTSYGWSYDYQTNGAYDDGFSVTLEGSDVTGGSKQEKFDNVVAQVIGDDGQPRNYQTFADALAGADEGDTVLLQKDLTEGITIDKAVTVDGSGHTITAAAGNAVTVTAGGVTLKNVNATSENGYALGTEGNTITDRIDGGITVDGGSYVINNSNKQGEGAIHIGVNGTVTIKDANVHGTLHVFTDTVPYIAGNTVGFDYTETPYAGILVYGIAASDDFNAQSLVDSNLISINSNVDGSDFAQVGVDWDHQDKVPASTSTASIGTEKYPTLADAIEAVSDGETITVTGTNGESVVVDREVSFTLDSGDFFTGTISAADGYILSVDGNTYSFTKDPSAGEEEPSTAYHKVKFDYMATGIDDVTIEVKDGDKVTAPEAPSIDGYKFDGWFVDPEGTTAYDFSAPVTNDIVLYAHWSVEELVETGTDEKPTDEADENDETKDIFQTGVDSLAPIAAGFGTVLAGIGAFIARRFSKE